MSLAAPYLNRDAVFVPPDPHTMPEAELIEKLSDPHWRLRNLYWVVNKDGKAQLFTPWPEQEKFYDNIWYRNVIPKARQRGFSTAVQLMMLDGAIFVPATSAAVIAQDDAIAIQIMQKKMKFAYDRLPDFIRNEVARVRYNNKHEFAWNNDSSMLVASSTRGNTLQWLHVSEYGQICAKSPDHAEEIQEGSLASVDQHGTIVVESTVETPFGHFSEMVKTAQAVQQSGRPLTPMDYRLHFASWWDADEYETDPTHIVISPKDKAYFHRIEAEIGRDISSRKRAWYVAKRDIEYGGASEKMWRQYPSTLDEAFTVSADGLWLSEALVLARVQNRIGKVPFRPGIPVNTFWDLRDNKVVWFQQAVDGNDHWINFFQCSGEPYSFVVRHMQELQSSHGYVWGRHVLPHDGDTKAESATQLKTPRDMLSDLGLRNIEIVPRIPDVTTGIDQLRQAFASYFFDEENCKDGIVHLGGYAKVWNKTMAVWSEEPAKNGHEHAADAIRQHAQWKHNMGSGGGGRPKRKNRGAMAA